MRSLASQPFILCLQTPTSVFPRCFPFSMLLRMRVAQSSSIGILEDRACSPGLEPLSPIRGFWRTSDCPRQTLLLLEAGTKPH